MESKRVNREAEQQPDHDHSQKGTFFSVLMVGAFIALTFVLLFGIYMSRV
ncbi:cytochrome c oxidase subunit 2A [Cohnella panacarvi]|nr:cytochrome c oxidase subunit 2A [Cohnella panacarvi]